MVELSAGDAQAIADLAQTLRLSKLTEEHGHKLVPATEALAMALRPGLPHSASEYGGGNYLQYLCEQAGIIRHGRGSFGGLMFGKSPFHRAGPLPYYLQKPILDKSEC